MSLLSRLRRPKLCPVCREPAQTGNRISAEAAAVLTVNPDDYCSAEHAEQGNDAMAW